MVKFDFEDKQASPEWLTSVLTKNGSLSKGKVSSVVQEPVAVPNSNQIADFYSLKVEYTSANMNGLPSRFLIKLIKPGFYGEKEIDFYKLITEEQPTFPMVRCFGVEKFPDIKRGYVLLEDLRETHHQPGWQLSPTSNECGDAVATLAKFHAHWWNHPRFGEPNFDIPTEEELLNSTRSIEKGFTQFADFMGDRLSEDRRRIYHLALEKAPQLLWSRITSLKHLTLFHGDAFYWNFLYPNNKRMDECVILDWRNWGVGLGSRDLAYMMALHWYPERRQRMEKTLLKGYLKELHKRYIDYNWEDLQIDYRISVIFNLAIPVIQHLEGAPAIIWWDHIERAFAAFEDLDCMELLD